MQLLPQGILFRYWPVVAFFTFSVMAQHSISTDGAMCWLPRLGGAKGHEYAHGSESSHRGVRHREVEYASPRRDRDQDRAVTEYACYQAVSRTARRDRLFFLGDQLPQGHS